MQDQAGFWLSPQQKFQWKVQQEALGRSRHLLLLREPYVRELAAALSKTLKRIVPDRPRQAR